MDQNGIAYAQVFPVTSVSAANRTLTLDENYWETPGTGGSLIIKGGITSAADNLSGNTRITSDVAHGLEIGDFVYIDKIHSNADLRTRTWRVIAADTLTFDIDAPPKSGSGGAWYGTCTPMREDRFDLPDLSRDDVREIYLSDWSRHVERSFTRHGARDLWIDENAALYKLTTVDAAPLFTPIDGTTERTLARLGRQKAIARKFGRRIMANLSWNPTKDAMSPAQRLQLLQSVDGMASEGACQVFLRSYYHMIGPDGFLEHLEWLLTRGFAYYYIPQAMAGAPGAISVHTNAGGLDTENGSSDFNVNGRMVFTLDSDGVMYPTFAHNLQAHNLAGQSFGLYGHSDASRNGVHRHRACTFPNPYRSECETAWVGAVGQGGKIVHTQFGRAMKALGLTSGAAVSGGNRWRVRTEFPHLIWEYGGTDANNPSEVYLYG